MLVGAWNPSLEEELRAVFRRRFANTTVSIEFEDPETGVRLDTVSIVAGSITEEDGALRWVAHVEAAPVDHPRRLVCFHVYDDGYEEVAVYRTRFTTDGYLPPGVTGKFDLDASFGL